MRRVALALVAACSFVTAGCFTIEQTMTFEKNLSGMAGVTMQVDLEPLAMFAAAMKSSMSEKPGKPSEAELAAMRKELLAEMGGDRKRIDLEKEKADAAAQLPAGVKLLDAAFKDDGFKMSARLLLGFDHASKLEQIKFKKDPPGHVKMDNPMDDPFGGLKIVDDGKTILVTSPARNPMADEKDEMGEMPMDAEMKAMFDSLFGGIRVLVKLTAPFDVVEHNAHRKEGSTLIWDYNMESLMKMSAAEVEQGVRVRYRK